MENTSMKMTGRSAIPMDIIWSIANQYNSPADVLALAKLNKDTWALLEPMVYEKEVTYARSTERFVYKERKDLYHYVLAMFGGLRLSTLPEYKSWEEMLPSWYAGNPNSDLSNSTLSFGYRHTQYEVLYERLLTEDKHGLALHSAIARSPRGSQLISKLIAAAQLHNKQGYLDGLDFPILPPPLMKAAGLGSVLLVRELLAAGCNVDIKFGNPSRQATNDGNYVSEVRNELERTGAARTSIFDWQSYPARRFTWDADIPEILKYLRTTFVKMEEPDLAGNLTDTFTPEQYAAMRGNTAALKVFLDARVAMATEPMSSFEMSTLITKAGDWPRSHRFKAHDFIFSYAPFLEYPPSHYFHEHRVVTREDKEACDDILVEEMLEGFMEFMNMSEL